MRFFQNISLQRKQTLIIMLTSAVVLLLACAAFLASDRLTFRKELIEDASVLADAIGTNCAAALDFNTPKAAEDTLQAFRANDNIIAACVYSPEGRVFAIYRRSPAAAFVPPPMQARAAEFVGNQLQLFRPIRQGSETCGTIFVACDLSDMAERTLRFLGIGAGVFAASLLVALGLSSSLQRLVSEPILQLAKIARTVAVEKNYAVRAAKRGDDELGQLADGFNEMLAQIQLRDGALQAATEDLEKRVEERTRELENTHKQLVEASRRGGMAEIATNVLHNVGNVLNSVNISAGLILDGVKKSKVAGLARVVTLLEDHAHHLGEFITHDPQGKHVPAHLSQLARHLTANQESIADELGSLQRNVEHIKEIVAMQQNYARFGGVREVLDLVSLVEDSLHINELSLARHGVAVVREFEPVPLMNVEKHKILQILVNLVRNAQQACQESGRVDKQVTVRVANAGGTVKITIGDNGVGIPSENLTRVFQHGFTTRRDGHGFGLHSGALAAKEMGGALSVRSDGAACGAEFTLELPAVPGASALH